MGLIRKNKWILLISLLAASCVAKQDDSPPEITVFFNNSDSSDTLVVNAGEILGMNAELRDNQGLNSLRLFLSKTSNIVTSGCVSSDEYQFIDITSLCTSSYSFEPTQVLPDSIVGIYSLELNVLDNDGNSAQEDVVVSVLNSGYPLLDSILINGAQSECSSTLESGLLSFSISLFGQCEQGIEEVQLSLYDAAGVLEDTQSYTVANEFLNDTYSLSVLNYEEYTLEIKLVSSTSVTAWAYVNIITQE